MSNYFTTAEKYGCIVNFLFLFFCDSIEELSVGLDFWF